MPDALVIARGLGMVAKEAARAGLDRVVPGGDSVPLRASEVTPTWLADAMGLPAGAIRSIDVLDEHSGTAGRARIAVDGDDVADHLFVKFSPSNYLQHVMMLLFDLGTREVFVYKTLGDELPVRVPHCYATGVDARRGRNVMVLEDLADLALFRDIRQPPTATEAEAVVDAMADQHASYWGTDRFAGDLQPLTGRSAAANLLGDMIRRRFLGNMKGLAADLVPTAMQQEGRIFFERSADIDAFWASEPQTVLHGDPHFGNLFFEGDTPGFFDWQVATAGAGARDVAYFSTMSIDSDLRREIERGLVERYAIRLDAAGVSVDLDHLWTLYRAGATEAYVSAVAAAEAGERAQDPAICRVGVERAVAAIADHDSFGVLAALVDGKRV
jgi:Phosphotransferase enzyme family